MNAKHKLILTSVIAIACTSSVAPAKLIYSVDFSSSTGTSISNVTGGTATLLGGSTGNPSGTISTATPFSAAGAGYLVAVGSGANGVNGGATLTPTAGNSWAALSPLSSNGSRVLQGAFDFFYRSDGRNVTATTGANTLRVLDYFVNNGSMRPIIAGGTNSTALELSFGHNMPGLKLPSNFVLTKGQTYHIGVTFTNDGTSSIARLYVASGSGAIDLSGATPAATTAATNLVTSGGGEPGSFGSGAFNLGALNARFAESHSLDAFRLYDSVPAEFAAVPEPTAFGALVTLAGVALAGRRRREAAV